ncbi:MAG: hypothetical protein V2I48_06795 [Xanthomonadales bacterium]|jgi:hypothetical protein|nr:hypothetical protein [Xanthomonadales bacterium]
MKSRMFQTVAKYAGTLLLAFSMALLIACGGTKVYNVDKTITYRDSLYNMATVRQVSGREEARLENGDVVQLRNKDKKELERFFKENPGTMVSMIVDLDDQEMVYLRMQVKNYSEYSRLKKRFDNALEDITKFMGDKKETQLKLK